MRRLFLVLASSAALTALVLSGATRIDDPKTFVTDVYKRLVAAESSGKSYIPPRDIYTARLEKLVRDDEKKSKGEVGCLDFDFWVNGQDSQLSKVSVTSQDESADRVTIVAKFVNSGTPQEIRFDFRRMAGRWQLDDARSVTGEGWTLSEILKCSR